MSPPSAVSPGLVLPPIAERTVAAVIERGANRTPDRVALIDRTTSLTYAQVWDAARRRASALLDIAGLGGRVLTMTDNTVDAALTWLGLATGGVVEVPVNTAYRGVVLARQVQDSGATAAVVEAHYLGRFLDAAEGTAVRAVVVRGEESSRSGRITVVRGELLDDGALPGAPVHHYAALVGTALVLAVGIGLSRIYLRVHHLSDVLAGWGLGAAIFALCGMIAVIVSASLRP